MNWDNTPGALNKELHEESRCAQRAFTLWEDPGWDKNARNQGRNDDGSSAAKELGQVSDDCSTDAGTCFHEDGCAGGAGIFHSLLRQHERGVGVL
ncbi:unnamed protein product [Aspergillus oryzae]|uniref:Unnamed protein product n=1 Tax=Aspergillus oryzae var. brunneus TaxID=332754 RepID=A0ABQ6KVG3_ASPOZ|nr:unnamed protein product [Aspergillus oryzae]GMF87291.1 unnamed protein product [Aspergillus oryzae]GMG03900.1 unnamed protein product [Aspergillus oryzae]GMG46767.1 unnamed protein product [Aspergillus oryzae var. brunneus]